MLFAATPAAPTLWLVLDVEAGSSCTAEDVSAAIRGLRPDLSIKTGKRPSATDLQVALAGSNGSLTLTMQGRGEPLIRNLPSAATSCTDASRTAALIVDRYLDEFYANAEETPIAPTAAPTSTHLRLAVGATLLQMPSGLSPSLSPGLALELGLRAGLVLLSLGGEVNLSGSKSIAPEHGTYHFQPAATWLAAGVSPRLGPGLLGVQGSLGLALSWARTESSGLNQQIYGSAVDPYLGLVASYFLDLPSHFSLGLRLEERFVPAPSEFVVEGVSASTVVAMRQFTADLALLAGYTFF